MTYSLMTYSAVSGIIMAMLYAVYHLTMKRTTLFSFNRHTLLAILLFSTAAPLTTISHEVSHAISNAGIALPDLEISLTGVNTPQTADSMSLIDILSVIYIAGLAIAAARMICNIIFITYISLSSRKAEICGTKVRLHSHNRLSPFCWGNMIFMPATMLGDDKRELSMMLAHETSHHRHLHWIDLLAANIMAAISWYNPCSWMIIRELVNLHEYEADRDTLDVCDDPVEYQLLLIKKTAGSRFHAFADSLNHSSLKKRITMMMKSQSKSSARLRALALLPAMAAALCLTNVSCVNESGETNAEPAEVAKPVAGETVVQETAAENANYAVPAKLPEFEGGMAEFYRLLGENIHYPEDAAEKGIEGRVILELIIGKDGEIEKTTVIKGIDKSLDKEAVATVRRLKANGAKFTPGYDENGNPIVTTFTLPVSFKLQ